MSSSLLTLSQISRVTASSVNNVGYCSGGLCGPAQATIDGVGSQDDNLSFYESSPGNLLSPLSPSLSLSISLSPFLTIISLYLSLFPSLTLFSLSLFSHISHTLSLYLSLALSLSLSLYSF
jgi:hypothetical protein